MSPALGHGARWSIATAQVVGTRPEQQDAHSRCGIRLDDGEVASVVLVADGMGGEAGGALAAETAVQAFVQACQDGTVSDIALRLRDATLAANAAVGGRAAGDPSLAGMGCTLVALALGRGRACWVSVGDSLLLRLRGDAIERLNADHSMAPALDEAALSGEMSFEEAAAHPQRSALLSALTGRPLSLMDEQSVPLAGDDIFILATDGLLTLSRGDIAAIAHCAGNPVAIAPSLVAAVNARERDDQDNCTIVAVRGASAYAPRRSRKAGLLLLGLGAVLVAAPASTLLWRGSADKAAPKAARPAELDTGRPGPRSTAASTKAKALKPSAPTAPTDRHRKRLRPKHAADKKADAVPAT
ncbi:MAG: Serine/threonine phosphatase [Alphaproteobacteria bacterium]|nr:Serine/threonine phosphatase [Alphaproteobacteria bacterium]